MPKETRRILFSSVEVYQALLHYTANHNKPVRDGMVVSMHFDPAEDPSLVLMVQTQGGEVENFSYKLAELGAAIITFCKRQRIPLPHKGKKSLIRVEDSVAIAIGYDWEIPIE